MVWPPGCRARRDSWWRERRPSVAFSATVKGALSCVGLARAQAPSSAPPRDRGRQAAPSSAFRAAGKGQVEAVIMLVWGPLLNPRRKEIADSAVKSRLPTISREREYAEAGGLMTYGPSIPDSFRRAAVFVDKILKGAKPADLPVEQPTKFQSILLRADQVVQ